MSLGLVDFLMSDIVLEIKNLTRRFGAFTAVDALILSVNAAEIFGLLGSHPVVTQGIWALRNFQRINFMGCLHHCSPWARYRFGKIHEIAT